MEPPANHSQRIELNDEAHARPPEELTAPLRVSYLALFSDWSMRDAQRAHVAALAMRFGVAPPARDAVHYTADFGPFRLKWERHSEFARYKFIVAGSGADPFANPAIDSVPEEWIAALSGELLVATHAAILPRDDVGTDWELVAGQWFAGNALVGSRVADGVATAVTDFRIRSDGFSRLLIIDDGLRPRQAGRLLQRLLEVDTYRMLAQLAFPIARSLVPKLAMADREIAAITNSLTMSDVLDESELLARLTQLNAEVESRASENHFRFGAALAYYRLVQQRIAELREQRIPAMQTFLEFTERRLAPAMKTSTAASERQDALSSRVARITQLLSTRIDIARERQGLALLQSMDRRAGLQLRLQQTVEGLSVAAVSYYIVGLIGYAAKSLHAWGVRTDPETIIGVSIPLVVLAVALGVRSIHRSVSHTEPTFPAN